MTQYYRISIQDGIQIDAQKECFYSKSPELGVTVFKNIRDAKRKFYSISKAEILRLTGLLRKAKSTRTRRAIPVMEKAE